MWRHTEKVAICKTGVEGDESLVLNNPDSNTGRNKSLCSQQA